MAYEFYATIEGTKQGKFKGESVRTAHKDKMAGLDFTYEVISPRDLASGQASGKRQHKPITFVKEWGPASPQLFNAVISNEVLKSVLFEFFKTNANGEEYIYHTIKLTNATVSDVSIFTAKAAKHIDGADTHELEQISLTFQKIEVSNNDGKTMFLDDWKK